MDSTDSNKELSNKLPVNKPVTNKKKSFRVYKGVHKSNNPPNKLNGKPVGRPKGSKPNFRGEPTWLLNGSGASNYVYTPEVVADLANNLVEWLVADEDNIFICDWCEHAKVPYTLPDKLALKHESFQSAYEQWKRKQQNKICKGAMHRKFDSGFSKFMLSCNHGMRDQSQIVVTGQADDPVTILFGLADNTSKGIVNIPSDMIE